MDIAQRIANESKDPHTKVGCIIVRNKQILSEGYNGTPSGSDNTMRDSEGKTLKTVIHSEANALMKLARYGGSSDGATIYCTHSPCFECAKLIVQAGIIRVVFERTYCNEAISFLRERGFNGQPRAYYTVLEREAEED